MKVLVCGSRDWSNHDLLRTRLSFLPRGTIIIHGGARGADKSAARAARSLGIPEVPYPANWRKNGRAAGIIRNLEMLDERPDLVIAFWDGRSRGTKHTIDEALRRGIETEIIQ